MISRTCSSFVHPECLLAVIILMSIKAVLSVAANSQGASPWRAAWGTQHTKAAKMRISAEAMVQDASLLRKYFGSANESATDKLQPAMVSRSHLDATRFANYTRKGIPLVVKEFASEWPMSNWTCESMAKDFGKEKIMRWGYGEFANLDAIKTMPKYTKLKSKKWFKNLPAKSPALVSSSKGLPPPPHIPSYHWHPYTWYGGSADSEDPEARNHQDEPLASRAAQQAIQDAYHLPALLKPSKMNMRGFKQRIEFFLGAPGSGADLHIDSICEPILSVQVAGQKRWWLMSMPPYAATTRQAAKDNVRKFENEHPDINLTIWDFEVGPGDALLFPPGFLHHTEAIGDTCSISASLQFRHPFGVQYIRDFADRLLFSKENSFCFVEVWSVFLTGYFRGFTRLQKKVRQRVGRSGTATEDVLDGAISAEVKQMFHGLDLDESGGISFAEISQHLQAEASAMIAMDEESVEFDEDLEAKDWFACHDIDEDGIVSNKEYTETLARIAGFYVRAQAEGACDEGCDTPLGKASPQPVDRYPGAPYDKRQGRWRHERAEL